MIIGDTHQICHSDACGVTPPEEHVDICHSYKDFIHLLLFLVQKILAKLYVHSLPQTWTTLFLHTKINATDFKSYMSKFKKIEHIKVFTQFRSNYFLKIDHIIIIYFSFPRVSWITISISMFFSILFCLSLSFSFSVHIIKSIPVIIQYLFFYLLWMADFF